MATSAATMLRNLGSAAGVNGIAALTAALATTPHQGQQNRAFWVLAAVVVVAVLTPAVVAPRCRTTTG